MANQFSRRYGITVGPALTSGWDANWTTYPVVYSPTVSGDFCLGLPGGMAARDILNQAAAKCPTSKIFMSGYSQVNINMSDRNSGMLMLLTGRYGGQEWRCVCKRCSKSSRQGKYNLKVRYLIC